MLRTLKVVHDLVILRRTQYKGTQPRTCRKRLLYLACTSLSTALGFAHSVIQMKRLLSVTLVSIMMLETVGAIQSFLPANRVREHSDKCFSWQLDKIYSPGDILELPGCGRVMCYLDGNSLKERMESCPRLQPQPPCYLAPPNLKYSYPLCCPKTVCPGDKGYRGNVCPGDFQTTNEKWASSGSGP